MVKKDKTLVYLGLGGNIGDVEKTIKSAASLLSRHPLIENFRLSPLYQTEPIDVIDSKEWFLNAVCSFQTSLDLKNLFNFIERIERRLGKTPKPKNQSRSIDIDLLFYGEESYKDGTIEVPHPRWKERLFVLLPLRDLTDSITLNTPSGREKIFLKDLIHLGKKT